MKDVQISEHSDWQRQHWYALESSYFNSPFFEYLQDDFHPIYIKRWKWLMDLNEALVEKCLEVLNLSHIQMDRTDEFVRGEKDESVLEMKEYYQVFKQKNGFLQDLSIIDLIFNMGPESVLYLTDKR